MSFACSTFAQTPQSDRQQFIRVEAPVIALTHVRVIDGTGAVATEDQTIVIADGKINAVGSNVSVPANAKVLDLTGYTVLPGLVGMHDHMFFPMGGVPPMYSDMGFSFPRLYLALGVTTIRTTGSVQPYLDLEIKKLIDAGRMIGPQMYITAPYLEGAGSFTPVMHTLTGADDARRMVNYWADAGATSFKAYMNITRDELRAAVEEAHKRGLKVTGHLCSIGFREAAEIGIDNLEHGIFPDSEFVPNKQPDKCPGAAVSASLRTLDVNSDPVKETIRTLVVKHVAVTSTLPVFEASAPLAPAQAGPTAIGAPSALLNPRMLNVMNNEARVRYLTARSRIAANSPQADLVRKGMCATEVTDDGMVLASGIPLRSPPLYQRVGIPGSGGPDWLRNDYEFIVCATRGGKLPWSNNVAMGQPPRYAPGGDPSHRRVDGSRVNRHGEEDGYASPQERADEGPHRVRQRNGDVYEPPEVANPGNVIRCVAGGGNMGDKLCHENEAPFPEYLAEFFVRSFCPPGGVVADPFSGSGTTGKMAVMHGRLFTGCDLRASQVKLTQRRLAAIQPVLFQES